MKFSRVSIHTVQKYSNKGTTGKISPQLIKTIENCTLATLDTEKKGITENKLWILNGRGNIEIMSFIDVRLIGIYSEIIQFVGYLINNKGKFKQGTKVEISAWN